MNSHNEEENKNTKRRIVMMIIILIIIILALLTNCSCTSNFFGRIGDFFKNEGTHTIKPGTNDKETITNKDLKFDSDNLNISLSDTDAKLSFSYSNIVPGTFSCTTSDASIATCYVKDNYIIIIPKKVGNITVSVKTESNGKIYEATSNVNIAEAKRFISLSKKNGTIDLNKSNTLKISYFLNNLSGKVSITSTDNKIATITEKNGIITITGKKVGNVKINISLDYGNINYTATFNLKVIDSSKDTPEKSSDSLLKSLTTSVGTINFNKNNTNYSFTVVNTKNISITAIPNSEKSTISYEFNGKKVSSLNNLILKDGKNTVTITVTAEDGTKTKYNININSIKKQDAYLSNIKVDGKDINFNKNNNEYNLTIPFNQEKVNVEIIKDKNITSATYTYNGKNISESELKNLIPIPGQNNTLIISLKSNTGNENNYKVNIYQPKREVEFKKDSYEIPIGSVNFPIEYLIYEDKNIIDDYNINDLNFTLEPNLGTIKKDKGFITITPNGTSGSAKLTIKYGKFTKEITIKFTDNDYYITSQKNEYDMILSSENNKRTIIFNTNVFNSNVIISNIEGGIRLTASENKSLYIDIKSDDNNLISKITTEINEIGVTSIPIEITAKNAGVATITATIHNGDKVIKGAEIKLNIKKNIIITLDSNGGLFNTFTKTYKFSLGENDKLDLSDRNKFDEPYKYVTTSCNKDIYPLLEYNTKIDGTGIKYSKDKIINYSDLNEDITLYAIYDYSKEEEKEEEYTLWITDIPLFHNEEYFNKYNEDKVIYPGASGYYIANIINETDDDITLTSLDLKEETICVSDGCLTMGYIIKYNDGTYYFMGDGKNNNKKYELLTNGKDSIYSKNIPVNPNIVIKPGEDNKIDLTFFWKWVETNDKLDTKIGNEAYRRGPKKDIYRLYIGLNFTKKNNCKVND